MKRQRGRGRKPGGGHHHNHQGGHPNRTMESNGPDIKVRGPAAHIYERYLQLARDAASSGDRVLSENYLQHADHYFRLVRLMQPAAPPPQPERFSGEAEFEGEDEGAPEAAEAREEGETVAAEGGEQPDVEFPQGDQPRFERGEGEGGRRRRGRRNRFRPGEGGEGGEGDGEERREARGEGGEGRRERGEGEGRRERQPRERDGEQGGPEGFSNGPRPAFLRGD